MGSLETLDRIVVLFGAVSFGLIAYCVGNSFYGVADEWRARMLEETELQLDELFLQIPARQIMNLASTIALALGTVAFMLVAASGDEIRLKSAGAIGLLTFGAILWIPRLLLKFLRQRRRERFGDQLEEALVSMSNSLKAGFSIQQAIESVVKQGKQPISIEFKLMMQQSRLGMSLDDALHNMAKRVDVEDFNLVATAIATARITGGDLTGILERLAELIRERMRIHRKVRSLTAQGRLQGLVLGLMPIFLLGVLSLINPTVIVGFFTQPMGIALFVCVLILELCGYLMIRKIVAIEV
ncbi:MAG: tight adherence protein B [Rhodothermales bacterium]|jgi:tight adherence protein B